MRERERAWREREPGERERERERVIDKNDITNNLSLYVYLK